MVDRKPLVKPSADEALPGRAETLEIENRHFVLGRPLKPPFPIGFKSALFGMGCFWGAERLFWTVPGVYSTAEESGRLLPGSLVRGVVRLCRVATGPEE